jgi:hypothetical protein
VRERFLERREMGKRGESEKQAREGRMEEAAIGMILTIFFLIFLLLVFPFRSNAYP